MPFTPFHIGFAILLFALLPFFDPLALVLGTILIDVEPIIYLLFGYGELHGIFHSFLGVLVLFIPISTISWLSYRTIDSVFAYKFSFDWFFSLCSSFLGLFSHIFFDAVIYPEIMLFFPFSKQNGIFYGLWSQHVDYLILALMFGMGILILAIKYTLKQISLKKIKNMESKNKG